MDTDYERIIPDYDAYLANFYPEIGLMPVSFTRKIDCDFILLTNSIAYSDRIWQAIHGLHAIADLWMSTSVPEGGISKIAFSQLNLSSPLLTCKPARFLDMIIAPFCNNEAERLSALLKYKILDTEFEGPYNDLVSLASHICDKPIALISLVDEQRQWFKARVGLDATETPRNLAFCAHAIHGEEILLIPDTLDDERFFDNPLVVENPKIRFYAGAPLITAEGFALGTLCVIDKKPGQLNSGQKSALTILARQVVGQLELRLRNLELENMNREKTQFIQMLSHDLRSAFSGVIGFSQFMAKRTAQFDTSKNLDLSNKINRAATQGLELLDSLLSWANLHSSQKRIEEEPFNVQSLHQEVIDYLAVIASEKEVVIDASGVADINVVFDRKILRSVIQNLLHNALKFSHPKGNITISVTQDEQWINFIIADEGVGMTQARAEALFSTQTYTSIGTQGEEGTGIGTQLIREFVTHYNGNIRVQSQPNHGTTIQIQLPHPIKSGSKVIN